MGKWDASEADPRVKWALDLLDNEGTHPNSLARVVGFYGLGFMCFAGLKPFNNFLKKRPLKAGIHHTVGYTIVGMIGMHLMRMYALDKKQREVTVMRHYIMSNPEKFPEPEDLKYGNKSVIFPWESNRI